MTAGEFETCFKGVLHVKYSIDMVRLRCEFEKQFLREFFAAACVFSPGIERWVGTGRREFRYNFKLGDSSGGSMWLGMEHNSERAQSDKTSLYVEWNPNKFNLVDEAVPERFRRLVGQVARRGEIVLIHLALDIMEGIENFLVDKRRKGNYKLFMTSKGVTHYIGNYGHGSVKVYDKGKEQGVDYPWTRIEYVIRYDCSVDSIGPVDFSEFPKVYRIRGESVSPLVKSLIFALQEGVIVFSDLTRTYKKKVKRECDLITIDGDKVNELVGELIGALRGLY